MSNPELSRLSEQEYLRGELVSELRHEYVDGHQVYAMAGAGEAGIKLLFPAKETEAQTLDLDQKAA